MTSVNNDTSSNITLLGKVESAFEAINKLANQYDVAIQTANQFTYQMVAGMVTVAQLCEADEDFAKAVVQFANKRDIKEPDIAAGQNAYLHIARLADVKREKRAVPTKSGETHYWKVNRSMEKHAKAIRFFMENHIPGDQVFDLLKTKGGKITLANGSEIDNTLAAVMEADLRAHPPVRRSKPVALTANDRAGLRSLKPLARTRVASSLRGEVQANEDGVAAVLVRFVNGEMQLIGGAGIEGDALTRLLSNRLSVLLEQSAQQEGEQREVVAPEVQQDAQMA